MAPPPSNVAPMGPATVPDVGLGKGWEPAVLMGVTLALFTFGLITLSSATTFLAHQAGDQAPRFVLQQAFGGALGLGALVVFSRVPLAWWRASAWPLMVFAWLLLMILILPGTETIAPRINGARRWLLLPIGRFQPSELAKMAIIIWTAALAVKKQAHFRSLRRGLLPFLLVWGAILLPIAAEPDFSTACLVGILAGIVVFCAGGRVGHFVFLGLLLLPVVAAKLGEGFRLDRIRAFWDPNFDPAGAGFQVRQSLVAIGSGGLTGVGFGEGRQKFGFLPEPHNDFIFAMIGEEWGLLGVLFVVSLFITLILVGFRIAQRAPDLFSELLAVGFTSLIALQATLHMSVGLGLVPNTGLALPLISYGRSNLVVTMASIGILIAIARAQPEMGRNRV
ncbi:MAG: cell division protein FtsW [Gemmatimonadetes bacterium]|nr:cell division protein FtsW [Gemmatimonadota bacterium]